MHLTVLKMKTVQVLALLCLLIMSHVYCKLQEMTWVLDRDYLSYFPKYEDALVFSHEMIYAGPFPGYNASFVSYGSYALSEHLGTHMDAPYHFARNGKHIDEIPLEDLNGPLVAIDISKRASEVKDASVSVFDLLAWERQYGEIPPRSFVLMYSGWDAYWGDNEKFVGSNDPKGPFHFPGFSPEAAQWLLDNRNVLGLGSDSLSCDPMSKLFEVHKIILPPGKFCIENLRNIGKVPVCGARFMILPIMLKDATGSQTRAFAEYFPGVGYQTSCYGTLRETASYFVGSSASFTVASNFVVVSLSALSILAFVLVDIHYFQKT